MWTLKLSEDKWPWNILLANGGVGTLKPVIFPLHNVFSWKRSMSLIKVGHGIFVAFIYSYGSSAHYHNWELECIA